MELKERSHSPDDVGTPHQASPRMQIALSLTSGIAAVTLTIAYLFSNTPSKEWMLWILSANIALMTGLFAFSNILGLTEISWQRRVAHFENEELKFAITKLGSSIRQYKIERQLVNDRLPVKDFRLEAVRLGVPIDPQPDASKAKDIVFKIASQSEDLFYTTAEAEANLVSRAIDNSGKTAVQLVQERGALALLIKLDQMRFGANG